MIALSASCRAETAEKDDKPRRSLGQESLGLSGSGTFSTSTAFPLLQGQSGLPITTGAVASGAEHSFGSLLGSGVNLGTQGVFGSGGLTGYDQAVTGAPAIATGSITSEAGFASGSFPLLGASIASQSVIGSAGLTGAINSVTPGPEISAGHAFGHFSSGNFGSGAVIGSEALINSAHSVTAQPAIASGHVFGGHSVYTNHGPHTHEYRQVNQQVPVAVPQPVPYEVTKRIPVPQPYPVEVPRPVPVPVRVNVPYEVPKPYNVPVPHPVPVRVPVKVPVEVPRPYPVEVIKRIPVEVPRKIVVKVCFRNGLFLNSWKTSLVLRMIKMNLCFISGTTSRSSPCTKASSS